MKTLFIPCMPGIFLQSFLNVSSDKNHIFTKNAIRNSVDLDQVLIQNTKGKKQDYS